MAMRRAAQSIEGMFAVLQERCNVVVSKRAGSGATEDADTKASAGDFPVALRTGERFTAYRTSDRDATVYRVAAQIKLLVDTPEQVRVENSWHIGGVTKYLQDLVHPRACL